MTGVDFPRIRSCWPWYLCAAVIVGLDQWSKFAVVASIPYGQLIEIWPVFDLAHARNYGAAFSFLDQQGGWQRWFLAGISIFVSVVLIFWWLPAQQRKFSLLSFTLILGGAVGNLYDRVAMGYVIDFISLHYGSYRFATFNIADSAISVGAVLLFIDWFVLEPRIRAANQKDSQSDDEVVPRA